MTNKDTKLGHLYNRSVKSLQLVAVAACAFSLLETGASQCDGEKKASERCCTSLSVVRLAAAVPTITRFFFSSKVSVELAHGEGTQRRVRRGTKVISNTPDMACYPDRITQLFV